MQTIVKAQIVEVGSVIQSQSKRDGETPFERRQVTAIVQGASRPEYVHFSILGKRVKEFDLRLNQVYTLWLDVTCRQREYEGKSYWNTDIVCTGMKE